MRDGATHIETVDLDEHPHGAEIGRNLAGRAGFEPINERETTFEISCYSREELIDCLNLVEATKSAVETYYETIEEGIDGIKPNLL